MAERNRLSRGAVRRTGSGTTGVEQIIAGAGITLSPLNGIGIVTITATAAAGVTSFNGATGAITLTTPNPGLNLTQTGGAEVLTQRIVADWPQANIRVYAIDPVNGLDTNAGFADAAGTSAGQYATACAAAGAVAKQTIAGLALIFPKVGAGRMAEIVIRNGGVNTASAFAETLGRLLNGMNGYAQGGPVVRGTGTNTTAGCVAFDGSIADAIYQGAITVTGLNVAGYNPVGATTSSLPCQLNGGGAAALPAEPAAPLGWRVRFDASTVTVALRNQCRQIAQVSGGNTIVPGSSFTAAPANGDVFYIEQAGVTVTVADVITGAGWATPSNPIANIGLGFQLNGIRWTVSLTLQQSECRVTFLGGALFSVTGGMNNINVDQILSHPVLGFLTIGGGVRCEGVGQYNSIDGFGRAGLSNFVVVGALTINGASSVTWGAGSYVGGILTWSNCTLPVGANGATSSPQIGVAPGLFPRSPRALRLIINNVQGTICECVFGPAGANPAVKVNNNCRLSFAIGVMSGSVGNTDVGLDLTTSFGSFIQTFNAAVTGALGDVRLGGGQITTWAQIFATGITDSKGNRTVGNVASMDITLFAGSVIGAVGAVISYLSNTGPVAANQIVALRRATSFRVASRLRSTILVHTSVNAVTLTLYKNGVATAMTLAYPPGTPPLTKNLDDTHPILFLDGDDFDLRLDDPAGDVGGVVSLSAALEWSTS